MTETFYDVLGVSADATTDEIQSAYRERLKEVHPDVNDDEDASEATQRLIEARDVLVDDEERERYDRIGHRAYVGDGSDTSVDSGTTGDADSSARSGTTADSDTARTDDASGGGQTGRNRAARERRASQRVKQERTRRAKQRTTTDRTHSAGTSEAGGGATAGTESTYNVREDVTTTRSFGPLFPTGERLTMLVIFFVLYPLLLFSALLPAFPLFVNVVVGACTLMLVGYLQSMPRISLLIFGGWSAISVTFMLLLGIDFLSLFGLVVLGSTVLPFAFSVLIAWALRY